MAVVVDRRAPKTAVLSTASPTRKSLRMNRSAGGRFGWTSETTLMGAPDPSSGVPRAQFYYRRLHMVGCSAARLNTLVDQSIGKPMNEGG